MAIQSQMQNPNLHLQHQPQQCYIHQCNNNAGRNNNPVSDWMIEKQNIANACGVGPTAWRNHGQNQIEGLPHGRVSNPDIDRYINLQSENLRQMMQEQRKVELAWLAKFFETQTLTLMQQKDEQIWQLMLRMVELERLRLKLQPENETLQTICIQNQAAIAALNQTIQLLRENNDVAYNSAPEDAGSRGDEWVPEPREEVGNVPRNNADEDGESSMVVRVFCRGCDSREATMVFLPCRHLCACDVCDNNLSSCPVCKAEKSSSIMALIF